MAMAISLISRLQVRRTIRPRFAGTIGAGSVSWPGCVTLRMGTRSSGRLERGEIWFGVMGERIREMGIVKLCVGYSIEEIKEYDLGFIILKYRG